MIPTPRPLPSPRPAARRPRRLLTAAALALGSLLPALQALAQCAATITSGNIAACNGAPVTLTANITNPGGAIVRWWRDGAIVQTGGTTYSIPALSAANDGSYFVTLSGGANSCSVASPAVTVSIIPTLSITSQPTARVTCTGSAVTFSVAVSPGFTPTYRWQRNGVDLFNGIRPTGAVYSGALSPNLTIQNATAAELGDYRCVISTPCQTLTSAAAPLSQATPLSFASLPAAPTICVGSTLTLSASVAGTGNTTYQWIRNGQNVVNGGNTSGANSPTLVITNTLAGNSGDYQLIATNGCNQITSPVIQAVVTSQSTAVDFPPQPATTCDGGSASFAVTTFGPAPRAFQWRRNGVNLADGPTPNGSLISGATSATLSLSTVDPADAGVFDCVITGVCNTIASSAAALTVRPLPVLTISPDITACRTTSVSIAASASGTGPFTFQWRRNGVNLANGVSPAGSSISGATSAILNISSLQFADAGAYTVAVTGPCGTTISPTCDLTVPGTLLFSQQPAPVNACAGSTRTFTAQAIGADPASIVYSWRRNGFELVNGGNISGVNTPTLTISNISAADIGTYSVSVFVRSTVTGGACTVFTSSLANLTIAPPSSVSIPAAFNRCVGQDILIPSSVTNATSFQWRRNGVNLTNGPRPGGAQVNGANSPTLSITAATAAESGIYTLVVSGSPCGPVTSNPSTVAVDAPLSITTQPEPNLILCVGSTLDLSVAAAGPNATYQWRFNGVNLVNGPASFNSVISGATSPALRITNFDGLMFGQYTCVISNACSNLTSSATTITRADPTPATLTSPSVLTVPQGGSTTIRIVLPLPLVPSSIRWSRNGAFINDGTTPAGSTVSGATTDSLTLSNLQPGDSAGYSPFVSYGGCGAPIGPLVTLTVTPVSPACSLADIVGIGGQPPADGLLTGDDFNAFIAAFAANGTLADIVAIGGTPPGDGLITGDDFNAYIAAFAAGCP